MLQDNYHKAKKESGYNSHVVSVAVARRGGWDTTMKVEDYQNVQHAPPSVLTILLHRDSKTKFHFFDEGLDGRCNDADIAFKNVDEKEWLAYFGIVPKPEWDEQERIQQLYHGALQKLIDFYQKK